MSTSGKTYLKLAEHYRRCLATHGDSARGMDWPREKDAVRRLSIMAEIFVPDFSTKRQVTVLDFGCGTGRFLDYLIAAGLDHRVIYSGIDILPESIEIARGKHPRNSFRCLDVLADMRAIGRYDYVTINGLFTQKRGMSEMQMRAFVRKMLSRLGPCFRRGLAFNTMSGEVDFKRRGSFHADLSWVARLLTREFSRNFVVRHDYGLYEQTFYLFKRERSQ